jgi:hypothetical protein
MSNFVVGMRGCLVLAAFSAVVPAFSVAGNLLDASGFTNVGMVRGSLGGGSGVPISKRWILTAGHVVRSNAGAAATNLSFRTGSLAAGTNYNIVTAVPHPTDDIALVEVDTDLPGWYAADLGPVKANQTGLDIVGYGLTATYNSGNSWTIDNNSYGTRRRGKNVVSDNNFNANLGRQFNDWKRVYRYDFDGNGTDTYGDGGPVTGGDALGLSGDSGAPLFATSGRNISVFALHVGRYTLQGAGGSDFGTLGVGIRLSDYSQFINDTVVPEPGTMAVLGLGALAAIRRKRKK